jgi:hypothetical protein
VGFKISLYKCCFFFKKFQAIRFQVRNQCRIIRYVQVGQVAQSGVLAELK